MDDILRGSLAFKGERGYSAYEVAVQNGFEGTVEEWLMMLGTSDRVANMLGDVRNELNAKIQGLVSGSPLVATSINGMTNTSHVYVNTTDGNWYYYNGSSWVIGGVYQSNGIANKSILNEYIADNSINERTTNFIENVSKNVFDGNVKIGYVNELGKHGSSDSYTYTDFIPISYSEYIALFVRNVITNNGETIPTESSYMGDGIRFVTWYDSNFNVITGNGYSNPDNANTESIQAVDENVAYCIVTFKKSYTTESNIKRIMLVKSDTQMLNTDIIPFNAYKENLTNNIFLNETEMNSTNNLIELKLANIFKGNMDNLLNPNAVSEGFVRNTGIFNNSSYRRLPKLAIKTGQYISLRSKNTNDIYSTIEDIRLICFYDINNNIVQFYDNESNTKETVKATAPDIAYCIVSIGKDYSNFDYMIQITDNDTTSESVEFKTFSYKLALASTDEILLQKRIINFGDSIANGDNGTSYGEQIATKYYMSYGNYARGGATLSTAREDNNIISQVQTFINEGNTADFILMNGGTNDILYSELGNITDFYVENDSNVWDSSTSGGALEKILSLLKTNCPESKIVYVIPHKMNTRNYAKQLEWFALIKEICNKWSIPVVSVFDEGNLNTNIEAMRIYTDGGTHPTTEGYEKFYVPLVESKLKQI